MTDNNKPVTTFPKGEQPRFVQAVDATFKVTQAEGADKGKYVFVEGEAARYGNWFQVVEFDGYQVMRRNNPGMFGRALAQNPDIVLRVNHQEALARTHAGTLEVWETDQALMFRGKINLQTTTGNDVAQMMSDGLVTQGSVSYMPTQVSEWSETQGGKHTEYQDVKEGKLDKGDVSVVIWGMNPQCSTTLAQMAQMMNPPTEQEAQPEADNPSGSGQEAQPEADGGGTGDGGTATAVAAAEPDPADNDLTQQQTRFRLRMKQKNYGRLVTRLEEDGRTASNPPSKATRANAAFPVSAEDNTASDLKGEDDG